MKINEIFKSIQGEGILQGIVTTFIRVSGCNLSCSWCDTPYHNEGKEITIAEILQKVSRLESPIICITGGEPFYSRDLYKLIYSLKEGLVTEDKTNTMTRYICVETNGTYYIAENMALYSLVDKFIVDYKLSSANPSKIFNEHNFNVLRASDELKFVIANESDYNEMKELVVQLYKELDCTILVSPVPGKEKWLAEKIIADNLPVRYSLQIHKKIWNPNQRGV